MRHKSKKFLCAVGTFATLLISPAALARKERELHDDDYFAAMGRDAGYRCWQERGSVSLCSGVLDAVSRKKGLEKAETLKRLPVLIRAEAAFSPVEEYETCMKLPQGNLLGCVELVKNKYERLDKSERMAQEPLVSNPNLQPSEGCIGKNIQDCLAIFRAAGRIYAPNLSSDLKSLDAVDISGRPYGQSSITSISFIPANNTKATYRIWLEVNKGRVVRKITYDLRRPLDDLSSEIDYNNSLVYELLKVGVGGCMPSDRKSFYIKINEIMKPSIRTGSRQLWVTSSGGNDSIDWQSDTFKLCDSYIVYNAEKGTNIAYVDIGNPFGSFSDYRLSVYKDVSAVAH